MFPIVKANGLAIDSKLFDSEQIDEFVGFTHDSYDKTKEILEANPLILNCASQIVKGDFETAMGGASHMGRKDIVELLISYGARMDIFTFAFLGHYDIVRYLIQLYPKLLTSYGPHGYTLLHHAKIGENKKLENWLIDNGLTKEIYSGIFDF